MAAEPFPQDVAEFIAQRISSLAMLETLLLLRSAPQEEWSARSVALRLYTTEHYAGDCLSALEKGELAARLNPPSGSSGREGPTYAYRPATEELDRLAGELARLYGERRVTVIELIFSKPTDRIRTFAEAFRIRKE